MTRPHITVVNYYYILPCNNGGKLATRDFYKALSEWFDVTVVCLINRESPFFSAFNLSPYLTIVPLSLPQELKELDETIKQEFHIGKIGRICEPTYVISVIRSAHNYNEVVTKLCEISANSSIIITEHVYAYRLVKAVADRRDDLAVWYRAQNVEFDYKHATWGAYGVPEYAYREVFDIERECCTNSDLVLTITPKDAARFQELYHTPTEKLLNISAGYDADSINFTLPSKRKDNITALYISSSAKVAVDAAYKIAEVARLFPYISFYIAGAVGGKLEQEEFPDNVIVTGLISDSKKLDFLTNCTFALNPIVGGSGLNIKMFEYFAAGIPVICTAFGARGIDVEDGRDCLITEPDDLAETIARFLTFTPEKRDDMAMNANALYHNYYTWRNSALKVIRQLSQVHLNLQDTAVSQDEIKLYRFQEGASFIPSGKIYIYGAGEWGNICLKFLQEQNVFPIAFLDNDKRKHGTLIHNIRVLPTDSEEIDYADGIIVFAIDVWDELIESVILKGVNTERIVIALCGNMLFRLSDGKGCVPFYIDYKKIKKEAGAICK